VLVQQRVSLDLMFYYNSVSDYCRLR